MPSFSDPITWPVQQQTMSTTNVAPTAATTAGRATTKRTVPKKSKESDTILLMEESMLDEDWMRGLQMYFLTLEEAMPANSKAPGSTSTLGYASSAAPLSLPSGSDQPADERRLRYKSLITPSAGLFQWLKISPEVSHKDWFYSDHLPHLYNMHALLCNSEEYCRLALSTQDEVTFPDLDAWIERVIAKLKQHSFQSKVGEPPRLVLIFSDLDKQVTKTQKKLSKEPANAHKVVSELVDSASTHLMLQYDIEVVRFKGIAEVADYLHTMSRALESQLERPLTAFNCVNKATRLKAGDELTGQQKEKFTLNQTWMAMMQMMPHMSKDRAMAAASNPQFSCVKRVYDAMNDTQIAKKQRKLSMQSTFGGRRDRDGNVLAKNPKLSRQMYRLMTIHDPTKNIGDDSEDDDRDGNDTASEAGGSVASATATGARQARAPKQTVMTTAIGTTANNTTTNRASSTAVGDTTTTKKSRSKKNKAETVSAIESAVQDTISITSGTEYMSEIGNNTYEEYQVHDYEYEDSCPFYEDGGDSKLGVFFQTQSQSAISPSFPSSYQESYTEIETIEID